MTNGLVRFMACAKRFVLSIRNSDTHSDKPMSTDNITKIIKSAYDTILLRNVDPQGMERWLDLLITGQKDIAQFLEYLFESDEFASRTDQFMRRYVKSDNIRFVNEYSQNGEIWLLIREMINAAATYKIVVDVGAHGRSGSNSYDLMRHFGWRGLLIEPNFQLRSKIESEFDGLNYTLLSMAVSDYNGKSVLYLGVDTEISSIQRQSTEHWGNVRNELEVSVDRLSTILESHNIPSDFDLLSIDTESEDIKILNDVIASGFYPRWIIFEAYNASKIKSLRELPLLPSVIDSYTIVAQTVPNLILKVNQ